MPVRTGRRGGAYGAHDLAPDQPGSSLAVLPGSWWSARARNHHSVQYSVRMYCFALRPPTVTQGRP